MTNEFSTNDLVWLEKRLAELSEEFDVNERDWASSDGVKRLQVGRRSEDILKEKKTILERINVARHVAIANILKEKFHFINYHAALKLFEELHDIHLSKSQGASAAFLIQDGNAKGANWCILRIIEFLRYRQVQDVRHFPIRVDPLMKFDQVMHSVGSYLFEKENVVSIPTNDIEKYKEYIIQSICSIITKSNNTAIIIEISDIDYLKNRDISIRRILSDLISRFWVPLTQKLHSSVKYGDRTKAKLILCVVASKPLEEDWIPASICCDFSRFNNKRFVNLPLSNITEGEIFEWLTTYIDVSFTYAKELASSIYYATDEGRPQSVYYTLERRLNERI